MSYNPQNADIADRSASKKPIGETKTHRLTSVDLKQIVDADRLYGPIDQSQADYFFATHPYGYLY